MPCFRLAQAPHEHHASAAATTSTTIFLDNRQQQPEPPPTPSPPCFSVPLRTSDRRIRLDVPGRRLPELHFRRDNPPPSVSLFFLLLPFLVVVYVYRCHWDRIRSRDSPPASVPDPLLLTSGVGSPLVLCSLFSVSVRLAR